MSAGRRKKCPHPEKIPHATEERALLTLKQMRDRGTLVGAQDSLAPYRCLCGAWHLGHDRKALRANLARVDALLARGLTAVPPDERTLTE